MTNKNVSMVVVATLVVGLALAVLTNNIAVTFLLTGVLLGFGTMMMWNSRAGR